MSWDIQKLQSYISDQVEENLNLDYKAAEALQKTDGKKKEVSKDVSAMANSSGGIIIYGIKEFNQPGKEHLPETIDPVKRTDISKEWLEQVINSNIQPKIEGIIIHPVTIASDTVAYVVEIPQSSTAHQANDKKYYKRYNFESVAMDDYEIRDIMGRLKHPIVDLHFVVERKLKVERDPINGTPIPGGQQRFEHELKVAIVNNGKIYANYVNYFVELPEEILSSEEKFLKDSTVQRGYKVFYGENTIRDVVDVQMGIGTSIPKYGPSRFDPILPGTSSRTKSIKLKTKLHARDYKLTWKIYADNAEERTGEISLADIMKNIVDV